MYFSRISIPGIHGKQKSIGYAGLILLLFLAGCFDDVNRDNPFDPLSESYNPVGALSGTVTNLARDGIRDIAISITTVSPSTNGPAFTQVSDRQGRFVFEDIPGGRYAISVTGEGYVPFQDTLTVLQDETVQRTIELNGAPFFTNVVARSAHINRVWPPPTDFIRLEFEAGVGDLDGILDLNNVWVEIPGLRVLEQLVFTGNPGGFNAFVSEDDFSGFNIHDIIGEQILFFVQDRSGYTVSSNPLQIGRIIEETPVVLSPQPGDVITVPDPDLTWVCEDIPFDFTYRIDLGRNDGFLRNVITRIDGLDPEEVCDANQEALFNSNVSLEQGEYFWTVSIVDELGNLSRSIEAGFVVRFDL